MPPPDRGRRPSPLATPMAPSRRCPHPARASLSLRPEPPSRRRHRAAVLLALVAAPLVAACEAGYSLDAVRAEAAKPVQRFDRLQALVGDGHGGGGELLAVGSYGVVLRSSDGGASWERQVLPGGPPLIDIARCADGSTAALAFDGALWVQEAAPSSSSSSASSPRDWQRRALPLRRAAPLALSCDPGGRYWVVGEFSAILWSGDGGESWVDVSLGEDALLTAIHFFDAQRAFIFGEFGTFLSSEDGGATWRARTPIAEDFYTQAAVFASPHEGWVVGVNGTIFYTGDGGESWQQEPAPTAAPLYGAVLHGGVPVVVGGLGTVLIRRGGRWSALPVEPPVRGYLRGVVSSGPDHLVVVGAGGTERRVDTAVSPAARPAPAPVSGGAARPLPRSVRG